MDYFPNPNSRGLTGNSSMMELACCQRCCWLFCTILLPCTLQYFPLYGDVVSYAFGGHCRGWAWSSRSFHRSWILNNNTWHQHHPINCQQFCQPRSVTKDSWTIMNHVIFCFLRMSWSISRQFCPTSTFKKGLAPFCSRKVFLSHCRCSFIFKAKFSQQMLVTLK